MLARESGAFNLRNSTFIELFPDLLKVSNAEYTISFLAFVVACMSPTEC